MEIAAAPDRWPGEPLIVVFFLALEQPLALPAGTAYEFMRSEPADWIERTLGHNFVGLRIHRVEEIMPLSVAKDRLAFDLAGRITGHADHNTSESEYSTDQLAPQTTILAMIAEAATVLLPDAEATSQHAVSDAFDRCLEELRRLMIAYFKVTNDARFRPITRHTCRMLLPYALVRSDDSWTSMGIFTANDGTATLSFPPEELSPEGLHALQVSLLRDTGANPSGLSVERNRAAQRLMQWTAITHPQWYFPTPPARSSSTEFSCSWPGRRAKRGMRLGTGLRASRASCPESLLTFRLGLAATGAHKKATPQ